MKLELSPKFNRGTKTNIYKSIFKEPILNILGKFCIEPMKALFKLGFIPKYMSRDIMIKVPSSKIIEALAIIINTNIHKNPGMLLEKFKRSPLVIKLLPLNDKK